VTAGPVQHRETVMGTVVTIDVYARPGTTDAQLIEAREQLVAAAAILHRADEVFSTWNPESPLSRLRRGEITASEAPAEVAEVIAACAAARDASGGWFDPWAMPGGFDPTGYVKGWAAQRAAAALSADWMAGVVVNAAGDIACHGCQPTGQPFRIGIADPAAPRQLTEIVELTGSIATSGSYERGAHLLDPRSGQPAARAASATVTGPDLGLADALATGLAVAGEAGLGFIRPLDNYEALIIGFDGSKSRTRQFPTAAAATPPG
jgi:FAD:protein FMN transferase